MKVIGLDGKTYSWKIQNNRYLEYNRPRSSYHIKAKKLLLSIYATEVILEEVYAPGSGKLFFDFFLPLRNLLIEVQGSQHEKSWFSDKSGLDLLKRKGKDKNKVRFAEINHLQLIALWYSESEDIWKKKLTGLI